MKVAIAQIEICPGHPDRNTQTVIREIKKAIEAGDDLIVFPEMTVPGYLLGDEWENDAFIRDCFLYNRIICEATEGIAAIWGNIDLNEKLRNEDGRIRKYNAAFFARDGKMLGVTHKTLLPKYRGFDDERHFYPARKEAQDRGVSVDSLIEPFTLVCGNEKRTVGIVICEDMWSDDYSVSPVEVLLNKGADLIVDISCSPWTLRKNQKRHSVVQNRVGNRDVYFIYSNNVGIQDNGKNIFLFDGNSTVYGKGGVPVKVAGSYTQETVRTMLWNGKDQYLKMPSATPEKDIEELYEGLLFGIKKFMERFSSGKVVIGLSGGIDSAVDAVLLSRALGAENIYAVNMPSRHNSETTRDAARQLALNLGIHYAVIPIQPGVDRTVKDLDSAVFTQMDGSGITTRLVPEGTVLENIQARDRGSRILAGTAAALGAIFVNNGNKTETAFGYATLYGDVNGALAPIADLYKSDVYRVGRFVNAHGEIIPNVIFDIPASAELSEDQNVDEGKGDPLYYPYHDLLVKAFVEFRMDPEIILRLYMNGRLAETLRCDQDLIDGYFPDAARFIADLEHKWGLYKINCFKRIQAPPVITLSKRAFGYDLRESQNGVHYTKAYLQLKKECLM